MQYKIFYFDFHKTISGMRYIFITISCMRWFEMKNHQIQMDGICIHHRTNAKERKSENEYTRSNILFKLRNSPLVIPVHFIVLPEYVQQFNFICTPAACTRISTDSHSVQ